MLFKIEQYGEPDHVAQERGNDHPQEPAIFNIPPVRSLINLH
jgi:hypothetical protein